MLDVSDEAAMVMQSGSYRMICRIDSWRGGELLAQDIPVASGTISEDVTSNVPEVLTFTVPRVDQGNVWSPGKDTDHPLAPWGQQLQVSLAVETSNGFEGFVRGWFLINHTDTDGETVTVSASGLLDLIAEANLVSPVQSSGNYTAQLRRLIEPALTVDFTNAPTDRAVASGVVWTDGRLDAVNELLDAWGAEAFVDPTGVLQVQTQADTAIVSLALSDALDGTTMQWGGSVTRDGGANAVVARGYTAAGADVQAAVYDTDPDSPTQYGGPFSPLPVPFISFSPLLTTATECTRAARTILANRQRQAARLVMADMVPFLALQLRDGVTVSSVDLGLDGAFGIVDQLVTPLTAGDATMSVGVRLL